MLASMYRFHRRNHVNRVFKQGKTSRSGCFMMKYRLDEQLSSPRFAIAVSKKVDKRAVVRNRIRRRVFEVIRLQLPQLASNLEAVVVVNDASVATMKPEELAEHIDKLLGDAGRGDS